MGINFLIALTAALGSATLMLLVLRVILKVTVPNAFKEMIPIPEKTVTETAKTPAPQMEQLIVDTATLLALSGQQINDLRGSKKQAMQVIYDISDITLASATGWEGGSLLDSSGQGARSFTIVDAKIPKIAKEKEEKTPTRDEILSPRGQSTPIFGAVKKSLGVPNETLCGSAR